MGNTYNRVDIWCCKYGENRYCERCANKYWCASEHTDLLNWCLGKWHVLPYVVVPPISAGVPLISTRVSAHCHAILLENIYWVCDPETCDCDDIFLLVFILLEVMTWHFRKLKFLHKIIHRKIRPIYDISALIQVLAWYHTCDWPLPEQNVSQFTEV